MSYPLTTRGPMPSANWTAQNPTLAQFERGKESDTGKWKEGPGAWNSLNYCNPSGLMPGGITSGTGSDINIDSADGITTIGDVEDGANGTKLVIDDGGESITSNGFFVAADGLLAPTGITTSGVAFSAGAGITLDRTVTPVATTGAQTINKMAGRVNFGIGETSLVVTNSLATNTNLIFAQILSNDATMKSVIVVPPATSGSFTLIPNAAPSAECKVAFWLTG